MDVLLKEELYRYCDQGPHQGQYRVDIAGSVYMSGPELDRYVRDGLRVGLGEAMQGPNRYPEPEPDARYPGFSTDLRWVLPGLEHLAWESLPPKTRAAYLRLREAAGLPEPKETP